MRQYNYVYDWTPAEHSQQTGTECWWCATDKEGETRVVQDGWGAGRKSGITSIKKSGIRRCSLPRSMNRSAVFRSTDRPPPVNHSTIAYYLTPQPIITTETGGGIKLPPRSFVFTDTYIQKAFTQVCLQDYPHLHNEPVSLILLVLFLAVILSPGRGV